MKNLQWLRQGKRRFSFVLLLQLLSIMVWAQSRITGRVTNAVNAGIPDISVIIRNTNLGTMTDADGNYSLGVNLKPGSYELVFSGIGYKAINHRIQLGNGASETANVQLVDDALKMDEVVVTGTSAGTTRRQLGSYISTVKADELRQGATGNVLAALQGKTAGAQISQNSGDPGGGISVRLRGISSVNSSSEPLYIIDGVIVNNATTRVTNTSGNYDGIGFVGNIGQNRLADINPDDVERVEILNGAAAAAIYGSRANAGVVQIFTKRGRSGEPTISFSTQVTMSELRKQVPYNTAPTKFGPEGLTQDIIATGRKQLNSTTFIDTLSTIITPVNRYNYQDYIFRTGIGTDNNVS